MIAQLLAETWTDLRHASPERWALVAGTVGIALVLAAVAEVEHPVVLLAVVGFAALAALQPASNSGLIVMLIVLARWLATADDPTTPTVIVMAVGLLAFHLTLTVMSTLPHSATMPAELRRRWLLRVGVLVVMAVGTWALVELLSRRSTVGASTLLATAAIVALAAGAAATVRATADARR